MREHIDNWCSEKKNAIICVSPKRKNETNNFLLSNKNTVRCVVKRVFVEPRVVKRVSRVVKRVSRVVKWYLV